MYYPGGQIFTRNRSISHGFRDIYTFLLSGKIQDGRHKLQKLKLFHFQWDTLVLLYRPKILLKLLYLLQFYVKMQDDRNKLQKLKLFHFQSGTLVIPVSQKITQNHSISYSLRHIANYTKVVLKIANKVPKWLLIAYLPSYKSQMQNQASYI